MSGNFNTYYEIIDQIPVLYIEGDMTSEADSRLLAIYQEIVKNFQFDFLIVNFGKTNYINSTGLATLINIIHFMEERKGRVLLTELSPHFTRVMDIIGITEFVRVFETNADALKHIKN